MRKINLKKGEIITVLTLVGLGVMLMGLTAGSLVLRQGTPLKLFSRATEPTPTPFNGANCVDSDGGNYPDTPGGVTTTISSFGSTRSVEYLDNCTEGYDGRKVLREYYCQGDQVKTFDQPCVNNCQVGGRGDYCSTEVRPTALPANRVSNGTLTLSVRNITANGGTVDVTLSLPGIASAPTLSRARYFVSVTGIGVSITPASQDDLFGSGSPEQKTKSFILTMDQSYRAQNCPAFTVGARAEYYDTDGFLQTVSPVTYSNAVPDSRNGCVPPSPTATFTPTPTVPGNEGGTVVRPDATNTPVPTIIIPGSITTATPIPTIVIPGSITTATPIPTIVIPGSITTATPIPTIVIPGSITTATPRPTQSFSCPSVGYRCMGSCEPTSKFFPAPQYSCPNDYFGSSQECCRVIVPNTPTPSPTTRPSPTPVLGLNPTVATVRICTQDGDQAPNNDPSECCSYTYRNVCGGSACVIICGGTLRVTTPVPPSPTPTRRPALCPQLPGLIAVDYVHDNVLNVQDFLVGVTSLRNHKTGVNALSLSRLLSNLGTNIASIQSSCPIITVEPPIPTSTPR